MVLVRRTPINDPATPVVTGMSVHFAEYIGNLGFGPDGSLWASYMNNGNLLVGCLTPLPR